MMWFWGSLIALGGGILAGFGYLRSRRQTFDYPPPETLILNPDEDLRVIRDDDNRIRVQWQRIGAEPRIFYEGRTISHADDGQAIIHDLDTAVRHNFEIEYEDQDGKQHRVTVAERVLPFEGTYNFRDLGGYPTHDGQRVRWGRVYRAGRLSALTPRDWAYLTELEVKIACDLRSKEEVEADPDHLPETVEYVHLPLKDTTSTADRLFALLFNPKRLQSMMPEAYTRVMIDQNAHIFGDILNRLADDANLPAVIHCTAGKDRTGVASALLLLMLGVPDEIIIADYTLSNRYYGDFLRVTEKLIARLNFLNISIDDLHPLLTAQAETMQITLQHIRDRHGTVETYLTNHAGVSTDTIERLREHLLE
jgi:protein-tyrosine phosphatase